MEGGVVHAVVYGLPDFVLIRCALGGFVVEAGKEFVIVDLVYVVYEFLGLGEELGFELGERRLKTCGYRALCGIAV